MRPRAIRVRAPDGVQPAHSPRSWTSGPGAPRQHLQVAAQHRRGPPHVGGTVPHSPARRGLRFPGASSPGGPGLPRQLGQ
eukprot:14015306-Alexandrium_andersonii.AAC.1